MKITTFNPLIVTKDAEGVIKLYEELGFERRHTITVQSNGKDITSVRMKDANVTTRFTLADDEALDLIRDNIDFLNKRLNEKGYSCIKWFVNSNEPNLTGAKGSSKNYNNNFNIWSQGVKNVRKALDDRGFNYIKIVGGDTTGFEGTDEGRIPAWGLHHGDGKNAGAESGRCDLPRRAGRY